MQVYLREVPTIVAENALFTRDLHFRLLVVISGETVGSLFGLIAPEQATPFMTAEQIEAIRERRLHGERSKDDPSFKDADARGADLSGITWDGEDFSGCDLQGANLSRCSFAGANFCNADLWNASLSDSDLTQASNLLPAQLAATDLTRATLPETLNSFEALGSVEALSQNSAKVFITILVAVVYSFLTIAGTKDVEVLTNSNSSRLPVIGAEIPIVGFYVATPLILLALFIYFHIYLQRLWEAIAKLPAVFPNGRRLDEKTYPWLMNDLARQHFPRLRSPAPPLAGLQAALSIFLGYGIVPLTLGALWLRFLRFATPFVTGIHLIVIAVAIGSAAYYLRLFRETLCRQGSRITPAARLSYFIGARRGLPAGGCILLATLGWSLAVFLLPKPRLGQFLRLDTAPRVNDEDISTKPSSWTGLDANRDAELGLTKGAVLNNKSLRGIQADGAFLAKAEIARLDLCHGDFSRADLRQTRMSDVKARKARFARCHFADDVPPSRVSSVDDALRKAAHPAAMQRCNFEGSDFFHAILNFVWVLDSDFSDVNFTKANCIGALFRNCDFKDARFHWANCNYAVFDTEELTRRGSDRFNMQGANFRDADCSDAKFIRCDLKGAGFDDAVLDHSAFDAVNLAEAHFDRAWLQGTDFSGAEGLTEDQLLKAKTLYNVTLPEYLRGKLLKEVATPPPFGLETEQKDRSQKLFKEGQDRWDELWKELKVR
jgi:uncharacterized protein YjbI with pentapeptide repeats